MKKILGKAAVFLAAFALSILGASGIAMADEPACDPSQSATGCMDNATCLYERWAYEGCQSDWVISIAQECKELWAEHSEWVTTDPVCAKYAPKHPKTVKVKKGMTLWRVAVKCYGYQYAYPEKAGHQWPKVAKRNHIKGKRIYAGQTLSC